MTTGTPPIPTGPPLSGLHILDLSTYVAGPSATMTLAQLGADVVRIDPLGGATDTGRLPLNSHGTSLFWQGLNKGKRSIQVDLRSEQGRDVVRRLLATPGDDYGILVTNAVGQPWLSSAALREVRPDLIHIQIEGRRDGSPAVDYTINAEVGLPLITGPTEFDRPVNHVLPAWDLLTGLHAAIGLLLAHRQRSLTHEPQTISLALADVATATMGHLGFIGDHMVNGTNRMQEGNFLFGSFGCDFSTRDGERVMVVALTPRHWRGLVQATDTSEVFLALERSMGVDLANEGERYKHRVVIAAVLAPWFESRTREEVQRVLSESNVLRGDYRTVEQLITDPQSLIGTSDLWSTIAQADGEEYLVPKSVLRLNGVPAARPAPRLGADTSEVLATWLGMQPDAIAALHDNGAVASSAGRS